MLKSPFHRSKRFAFMKSSMKKFKTQFKLQEGNQRKNGPHMYTNQERFLTIEEEARNSIYIPTNERHYHCMRLLYDDQRGWIEEELHEELEIFYDCEEEIESCEAHFICKREDKIVRDSFNAVENFASKNLQDVGVNNEELSFENLISKASDEETTTNDLAEKEVEVLMDTIVKGGAAPGIIIKKESNYCRRIFILGVVFVVIGFIYQSEIIHVG